MTVDAVLEACVQVLRARGYAGATLARIAERAGVSVGSIYQYFPTKEALLAAVMERHLEHMQTALAAAAAAAWEQPLELAVRALVTASVDAHLDDPDLHRVFVEEVPRVGRLDAYDRAQDALTEAFAALIATRTDVRAADPGRVARLIVVTVDAAVHDLVWVKTDPEERRAATEEIVTLVTRYLAPSPPG
jgi:AcrR family transcriptional regulator